MNLLEMVREDPRGRTTARTATLALVLAGLASFQVAATAYYGFFRLGGEFDRNPATEAIVALVGGLGLLPSLVLGAALLVRASVAFVHGVPRRPGWRLAGLALAPLFLAAFLGAASEPGSGGTFGRLVGGTVAATIGEVGAGTVLAVGTALAALLSTGILEWRRGPRRATPPPLPDEGAFGGVSVSEARGLVGEIEEEEPIVLVDDGWPAGDVAEEGSPLSSAATPGFEELVERVEISELYGSIGVGPSAEEADVGTPEPTARSEDLVEPESLPDPEEPAEASEATSEAEATEEEDDEAYLAPAAEAILEAGRASVSVLQQQLSIPFVRASRLLDRLEEEGLVGPYRGGSKRDILIGREAWENRSSRR